MENVFQFSPPEDPINKNSTNGKEARYAKEKMTFSEQKIYDQELAVFVNSKQDLVKKMEQAYSTLDGQCLEFLQHNF